MKYIYLILAPAMTILTSCVTNEVTGESEPKWVFWVFLGLLGFGLIFGAFAGLVKSKKKKDSGEEDSSIPPQVEHEIEHLEEKIEKEEKEEDKNA